MKVEVSEDTLISTREYSRSDTWKIPLSPTPSLVPHSTPTPEPTRSQRTWWAPCGLRISQNSLWAMPPLPVPSRPSWNDGHVKRNILWERLFLHVIWTQRNLARLWLSCKVGLLSLMAPTTTAWISILRPGKSAPANYCRWPLQKRICSLPTIHSPKTEAFSGFS